MHQIRTTPGFIIDSRPYGEAGKVLSIFTRDFGLVMATAQGIRLERSKLRYYAQLYSLGTFSLVRGKEFWRLTSAAEMRPLGGGSFPATREAPRGNVRSQKGAFLSRLALLLRRLLQGEEAHPEAFDVVESGIRFIDEQPDLNEEQMETLESLTVARILHWLGYIGDAADLNGHMKTFEIDAGLLDALKEKRAALNRHINKALKESQL